MKHVCVWLATVVCNTHCVVWSIRNGWLRREQRAPRGASDKLSRFKSCYLLQGARNASSDIA